MKEEFNLQKFIIMVVIIGTVLVIGIYITSSMQTVMFTKGVSVSMVNESLAKPTMSGITLTTGASARDGACGTVTNIINGTDGIIITLGHITQTGCIIKNTTSTENYTTNWLYSYSYTFTNDTVSSNAALNVTTALGTGTSWISILVVVGFATIILTMLTSGLGNAARETGGQPYY